jgi:hypothetical protein
MTELSCETEGLADRIEACRTEAGPTFWTDCEQAAEEIRVSAAAAQDEATANEAWFLRVVSEMRGGMVRCFDQMRTGAHLEAWCGLERIEIAAQWLALNPFFPAHRFDIPGLVMQVREWQQLFPYRVFGSPEIAVKQAECSVCGARIDPWNVCGHRLGYVYLGVLCTRLITECSMVAISMVLDPVQKFSVMIARDEDGNDPSDYSLVEFVVSRLENPFDRWSGKWTRAYHPHSLFANRDGADACPCDSGRTYSDCCLSRPGVMRPHYHVAFERPPPCALPNVAFAGYSGREALVA